MGLAPSLSVRRTIACTVVESGIWCHARKAPAISRIVNPVSCGCLNAESMLHTADDTMNNAALAGSVMMLAEMTGDGQIATESVGNTCGRGICLSRSDARTTFVESMMREGRLNRR